MGLKTNKKWLTHLVIFFFSFYCRNRSISLQIVSVDTVGASDVVVADQTILLACWARAPSTGHVVGSQTLGAIWWTRTSHTPCGAWLATLVGMEVKPCHALDARLRSFVVVQTECWENNANKVRVSVETASTLYLPFPNLLKKKKKSYIYFSYSSQDILRYLSDSS